MDTGDQSYPQNLAYENHVYLMQEKRLPGMSEVEVVFVPPCFLAHPPHARIVLIKYKPMVFAGFPLKGAMKGP